MTAPRFERVGLLPLPARTFIPRRYRPGNLGNWSGHLPFANDLIAALRPSLLVELGTHYGESYFGMCQAVEENRLSCQCYAVDTWRGDPHAGYYDDSVFEEVSAYNGANYAAFSKLLRTTFDDALRHFGDASVDLLHIDGLHTYDAVRHDVASWFPKLRAGGVMLLHDICVRHADFEVWRLWEELAAQYPHLEFHHSWGLGVVRKPGGATSPDLIEAFFAGDPSSATFLRHYYSMQAELVDRRHANRRAPGAPDTFFQVFPSVAGKYDEATSLIAPLKTGEWQQIVFELAQGSETGPIRIDPADRPCVVQIAGIVLKRAIDGSVVRSWSTREELETLVPLADLLTIDFDNGITFVSTGRDSQFLLPEIEGGAANQPLVFEARIRIADDLGPALGVVQSGAGEGHPLHAALDRDRALRERDAALVRAEQLTAEIRNLQAERVAVVADYRRMHGINESLTSELAALKQTLASHRAQGAEIAALESDLKRQGEETNRLARDLDRVIHSRSWRLTAPLRWFRRTVG